MALGATRANVLFDVLKRGGALACFLPGILAAQLDPREALTSE